MIPWIAAGSVAGAWLLWTVAPWFRRGAVTDHTEYRGDTVTSIQEIALDAPPPDLGARYFRHLRRLGGFLVWWPSFSAARSAVRFLVFPLVRFGALRSEPDRETLTVGNALLSRHGGTFAFVRGHGRVRVELRGFRPRMPMLLYRSLQLPLHRRSVRSFLSSLRSHP